MFALPAAKSASSKNQISTVEARQQKESAGEATHQRQSSHFSSATVAGVSLPTPPNDPRTQDSAVDASRVATIKRKSWTDFAGIPVFSADEQRLQTYPDFAVRHLPVQAKLSVGSVDDPLEHEADRVAEQVMRAPVLGVSHSTAPPQINRKWGAGAGRVAAVAEAPRIVDDVLGSPGQRLDPVTCAFMEPRFGRDFSNVRIHTDATARSANAIHARAYTAGNHLVFGAGQFAPGSAAGRTLLAHELTHVVQQGKGATVAVQRSPKKDDDEAASSRPSDVKVAEKLEGTRFIHNERLDRGHEHALLIKVSDFSVPTHIQITERLYRGQELPSLRGNKKEISWTDVTKEAQGDGPLSVEWNMPSVDEGDKKKQLEKDRQLAAQHPNPVLSLFVPTSNLYVKDRSSEIHDPQIRSQYNVDRQGIEAGTNLGRATTAVVVAASDVAVLAPGVVEAGAALAPEATYAANAIYLNAPSIYASAVLYGGAVMTGAALAAHVQKIRTKGFKASEDIPEFAEDLLPAVGGYLEAQSFNVRAPQGKPSVALTRSGGASTGGAGGGGAAGEDSGPEFVPLGKAEYDPQTKRVYGSVARRGSDEIFDADFDPRTGNGQIIERRSRQVVGIIDNGEMRRPAAAALPSGSSAADGHADGPTVPKAPPAAVATSVAAARATAPSGALSSTPSKPGDVSSRPAVQGSAPAPAKAPAAPATQNGTGRVQGKNAGSSPDAGAPNQKLLDRKEKTITSDVDSRSAKVAKRDKTDAKSVHEIKKVSTNPSDQSEVRIAKRFAEDGYDVHVNDDHKTKGDLTLDGIGTDVKHLEKTDSITSAINRAAKQGVTQVILDGTTVKLTEENTAAGIKDFETEFAKHPGIYRNLKTIYILEGDGTIHVYHTAQSDVSPIIVKDK